MNRFTDNKKIWNTVKPLFSDNVGGSQKITLVKDGKIISNDNEIAVTFNNFFRDAVTSLNISTNKMLETDTTELSDHVDIAIKKIREPS